MFGDFLAQILKFVILVTSWVLRIKYKHFSDFLEFPKIPCFKSFANSWSKSYIHFLVIKIYFCFIWG